jgi:hypothetical protein
MVQHAGVERSTLIDRSTLEVQMVLVLSGEFALLGEEHSIILILED